MTVSLQRCSACEAYQYPARDLCRVCLSDALHPVEQVYAGTVLAQARIHRSLDPQALAQGPRRIGTVALDVGVRVIAMLDDDVSAGERVCLRHDKGEDPRVVHAGLVEEQATSIAERKTSS